MPGPLCMQPICKGGARLNYIGLSISHHTKPARVATHRHRQGSSGIGGRDAGRAAAADAVLADASAPHLAPSVSSVSMMSAAGGGSMDGGGLGDVSVSRHTARLLALEAKLQVGSGGCVAGQASCMAGQAACSMHMGARMHGQACRAPTPPYHAWLSWQCMYTPPAQIPLLHPSDRMPWHTHAMLVPPFSIDHPHACI